jgi:hypothetical protein
VIVDDDTRRGYGYSPKKTTMTRLAEPDVSIERAKADLANLEARANALEAELANVRAEIEQIKIFLRLSSKYGVVGEMVHISGHGHVVQSNETDKSRVFIDDSGFSNTVLMDACSGKSIPDAAIELIRLAGRPLSEDAIVDGLQRGGVTLISKTPAVNLRFALLRKRKETGAVKQTDEKLWDLNHSANSESEIHKQSGFVQNRDRNNHAERSRQGLSAARQRGVKNGPRSKITPEIKEIAEGLIVKGVSLKEIAELIGVTAPTLNRWRKSGLLSANKL